jgi:hypothetical protein
MRLPTLLALLATITPFSAAQKAAPTHNPAPARHAIPRFNLPTGDFAFSRDAHQPGFRRTSPYTSLPFPFFGDSFTPDDIYSTGYPVSSQPPMILLQAARAMSGATDYLGQPGLGQPGIDHEPSPTQPLMIELQNGRYVRITTAAVDGEAQPLTLAHDRDQPDNLQSTKSTHTRSTMQIESNAANPTGPMLAAATPAPNLPPVLLVFRDGHSEEVRDYTIADGILYARGDFYTDGFWNKKISLYTLNLTQTLEANTARNMKFVLPSSPNEVITRP